MSVDTIVTILGIVLTTVVALAAYVTATRANRIQASSAIIAVDAQAYQRARESYEAALATSRQEIADVRADMAAVRGELAAVRVSNDRLRTEIVRLRAQLAT